MASLFNPSQGCFISINDLLIAFLQFGDLVHRHQSSKFLRYMLPDNHEKTK